MLKPPNMKDDPKNKNKNKNIDKTDDGKTRKISDMFKKKSIDKSGDEQRQDASKDDKNAIPGQNHHERVPLDSVVTTRITFNNIPDNIPDRHSAVKPDLAEIQINKIFPDNNLGESSLQISES